MEMNKLPLYHEQPEIEFDEWLPLRQQLQQQLEQQQRQCPDIEGRDVLPRLQEEAALYEGYFKRKRDGTA